jgi:hypothetical protein
MLCFDKYFVALREYVAPLIPLRLQERDIITMGSTELQVHIADLDTIIDVDDENATASV